MDYFDEFNMPQQKMTVAQRKEQIQLLIARMREKGENIAPISLSGQKIAKSFWGKAWCDNIDNFADYQSRLRVARNYLRHGAVIDLKISENKITSLVSGSELYQVEIKFKALDEYQLKEFHNEISKNITSVIDLLNGNITDEIIEIICHEDYGLFPKENEIILDCNCPDYADVCKHIAATMYAVGIKLDDDPELFFTLRGIELNDNFFANNINILTSPDVIEAEELSLDDAAEMFGIEFDE